MTWLNATDLVVRSGLYWFIEKHPVAMIIDLLNFSIAQNIECGLIFDGNQESGWKQSEWRFLTMPTFYGGLYPHRFMKVDIGIVV